MANRQGDVDLRFAQVSAPQLELWLGLAWRGIKGGQILFTVYSLNAVEMHKQVNLCYIHAMIYSILEVRYLS